MPDPSSGISIIWSGVAAAAIAATAAMGAAFISRQAKISEFRQQWINALRDDIADYIRSADKWFDTYDDINDTLDQALKLEKVKQADEARYDTLKLLRRITHVRKAGSPGDCPAIRRLTCDRGDLTWSPQYSLSGPHGRSVAFGPSRPIQMHELIDGWNIAHLKP